MEINPVLGDRRHRYGKIGILMGGPSSEREISLKSGKAVYESLVGANFDVTAVDIQSDNKEENINLLKPLGIDCAFIALHGRFGEDGQIQSILDALGITYTGSGEESSRLAMDKIASHRIFSDNALPAPKYEVLTKGSAVDPGAILKTFGLPVVVKPATHGSSVGLTIVDKMEDFKEALRLAFSFDDRILVEEYIKGREMTVGILDDKALPVIEILPKNRFFDFEAKYKAGMTDYIVPAQISERDFAKIQEAALRAHRLLGCYGCSRVDVILPKTGLPFVLEVNTIPGLTATSLLPKAAKTVGIDFNTLCLKLIKLAYEKKQESIKP
ncbi:MAG: D-alanine--D-alanine ligase [Candidatus Omnitrophica bacterium]|nr:D-alanine--D-alanine ligase [Candidatus Omnitrophota bacterium]